MRVADSGLTHYLQLLKRSLWIVVLTVALVTATAVYLSGRQAKLYRSSADVFLGTQSLATALAGVQAPSSDPVREATTQASLAQTPIVAERALRRAGLGNRSATELLANSSVTPAPNADILTFSVQDHQPSVAEKLAEDYAAAYTQYRRQLDTLSLSQARKDLGKQLTQLRRLGLEHTAAYANLADKEQQLSTLEVLQGSNALLVRSAGPAAQIQPKPLRNGILAAVLGLVLGLGLAFLREALNTRVRSTVEVQERLELPLLGRLPEPPRRFRSQNQLAMLAEPHSPGAEAFRILATNLDFVNLERGARTIMFTSATRSEGKSTTVANLAVALARTGRRVVLVDLDLRKPALDGLFSLGEQPGLTTVALGRTQLDEALVPIPLLGGSEATPSTDGAIQGVLTVLPVGPLPPNPAEFVGSHALAAILAELEKRADLILVDAPPLLDLSDAMTLTSRVDGLVVVTRLPSIRRASLQELHRVLAAAPVTKLGFVATGTTSDGEPYKAYGYGRQAADESRTQWDTAHTELRRQAADDL